MSHVAQPTLSTRSQLRAHWIAAASALFALLAAIAVTLVLVIGDNDSSATGSVANPQAAVRSDGGPNESDTAAAIGLHRSFGGPRMRPAGPDESAVAASISGR